MAVSPMLYTLIWIASTIFNLTLYVGEFIFVGFSIFSVYVLLKERKTLTWLYFTLLPAWGFLLILPPIILLIITILVISLVLFFISPSYPNHTFKAIFFELLKENLISLIILWEIIYIPDNTFSRLKKTLLFTFFFFAPLIFIIFFTFHNLFILLILLITFSTAFFFGMLSRFLIQFIKFYPDSKILLVHPYQPKNINRFGKALKLISQKHPLGATIQEDFFDDNLQIGDFYLVYPLFFRVGRHLDPPFSIDNEIKNIWHLIRWESAFSKQTGSAASRWSSIFDLKVAYIDSRVHRIHTPLIPVYNADLYNQLEAQGLICFDPFNQAPFWSPYIITTNLLDWKLDELNEERLNEIEEEDWQCSLIRTLSLHLRRGKSLPRAIVFGDSTNKEYLRWLFSKNYIHSGFI